MESGINKTMKVLWFTNTPSLAEGYINKKPMGGGWIKSLEKAVQKKVDLSVAFYHQEDLKSFRFRQTTYYPVFKKKGNKWYKIKNRVLCLLEPEEDINRFLNVVEQVKPDIIHIHGTEQPFGLIQKYTDIPTVVSIQGNLSVYTHKFFSGISYNSVLKNSRFSSLLFFQSFINTYRRFIKAAEREKEIFKYSKYIIGRTSWDKRIAKVLAPNAKYFHNDEVLRDVFYEKSWSLIKPNSILNLYTTTGPNLYKGLETIFDAARLLDNNGTKFKWHIGGILKNDEIVRLASKGLTKNISPNIEFLGHLNESQLIEQLLQAHLYVMASHIENSPNNLCEAQILGLPCIAAFAGGTSSLIHDNQHGILIQDGDPYVLAGAVMDVMENYDQAIAEGKKSRENALVRHNTDKNVDDLLKIYITVSVESYFINKL